jgi:hypothetical protein
MGSSGSGTGSTLSLVRITEELLERKSSGVGLRNRVYRPWVFRRAAVVVS